MKLRMSELSKVMRSLGVSWAQGLCAFHSAKPPKWTNIFVGSRAMPLNYHPSPSPFFLLLTSHTSVVHLLQLVSQY